MKVTYTFFLHKKQEYKKHEAQIRQKLRNTNRLSIKIKLEKTNHLIAASSRLLLPLGISRLLRNILETFKAGFDKIPRNIQDEGRKFVSYKKNVYCHPPFLTATHSKVDLASFNRKNSLIADPVWNHIGFGCLHDAAFILYRIHKGIHSVLYSSSSSCKRKANTV